MKDLLPVDKVVERTFGAGSSINTRNADGSLNVTLPDGSKADVDFNKLAERNGIKDLSKYDLQFNSPESYKPDNAMGFTDQLEFIKAGTPTQQLGLLKRKYGDENVVQDADGFKVKDSSGFWKKADTNWYNEVLAGTPGMAASIAGTIAGAKAGAIAGTAILPGAGTATGAVLGGILGGATSATLAKLGENKAAEAMGIRTEEDLSQMKDELGREFATSVIWDTITLGTGKALKAMAPAAKNALADTLGALVKGTDSADWRLIMQDADIAKRIMKVSAKDAEEATKGVLRSELMPSTKDMASVFGKSIEQSKVVAERQYEKSLSELYTAGVFDFSHKPIDSVRNGLVEDLSKAGLIKFDAKGKPLFKKAIEMTDDIVGVVDEKAQKRLRHTFNVVEGMYEKQLAGVPGAAALQNKPELGDLLKLKRFIGEVQKDLGHFMSASSVSDQPGRILSKAARATDDIFRVGANHVSIGVNGVPAGKLFDNMQSKYSLFRASYDDIVKKAKDLNIEHLGNAQDLAKLVGNLDTEGGARLLQNYKNIAESIGSPAMLKNLGELKIINAGKNLAKDQYGKGWSAVPQILARGSAKNISRIVGTTTRAVGGLNNAVGQVGKYTGLAKGIQFLKQLPIDERTKLMTNNKLLSEFMQGITGVQLLQQQTEQQLMQQVP